MSSSTRRDFLRQASLGVAVAGVAGAAPELLTTPASATPQAKDAAEPVNADEQVVAYVKDVRSGEVHLMHGESSVVRHDKALAAAIARATKEA